MPKVRSALYECALARAKVETRDEPFFSVVAGVGVALTDAVEKGDFSKFQRDALKTILILLPELLYPENFLVGPES